MESVDQPAEGVAIVFVVATVFGVGACFGGWEVPISPGSPQGHRECSQMFQVGF